MSSRLKGFTLIEVLVSLLVLSFVLAGLFSLTRSTLRFTGLTRAMSTSIEDIADAEGYLTDMIRNAKAVYGSASVPGFSCNNTTAPIGRCIAVVSPVLGTGVGQPITNFDLSVFSVQDIGNLFLATGLDRGWIGPGGERLALVEYRVTELCGVSGCSQISQIPGAPNVRTGNVTVDVGFLLGSLAAVDESGAGVVFFDAPEDAEYTVQVSIVVRADAQASQPFVVKRTPVALQVAMRP